MLRMPQVGRPIYVTLGLAILILTVTYGGMEIWPRIESYRRMRELDRLWRDRSLSTGERAKAAEMLAEFGSDATPYLMEAACDADGRVREKAYTYLASLDPVPDEALALCLSALKGDREPRARAALAVTLGSVAFAAQEDRHGRRRIVLDSLAEAGSDESPMVRHAVVRAMVGANAVGVDLGRWLEDSDRSVRLAAAEAVFWLAPARKGRMVPMLQEMVLQGGPDRPGDVARPLGLLYRADPSACRGLVPTFVSWLRHDDADARGRVVLWLTHLGPLARDATPALEQMLDRGRPADRARAASAIIHIDPAGCDRAVACLLALLADAAVNPRDRGLALYSFDTMFRQARAPARLRADTLRNLRPILDQPGLHPELGSKIRQFVDYYEQPRPPAGSRGPTARFVSSHMPP